MPYRKPEQKGLSNSEDSIVQRHKPNKLVPRLEHIPIHTTNTKLLPWKHKAS